MMIVKSIEWFVEEISGDEIVDVSHWATKGEALAYAATLDYADVAKVTMIAEGPDTAHLSETARHYDYIENEYR